MNKLLNYYFYHIELKNQKIASLKKKDCNGKMVKIKSFEKPVTENKLPKIYVVKDALDVAYVGITSQSIRNRLRYGLEAKGRGGYHGYKFKNLNGINLFVFCFKKKTIDNIEAIEAEIVYLIRHKTKNWPKYQTEIHFHKATEKEKKLAILIYEIIK